MPAVLLAPRCRDYDRGMRGVVAVGLLCLGLVSCAGRVPTVEEANQAVLMLREYGAWAWAVGIALIWADLVLPVPQTAIITAFGIIYGLVLGGLLGTVGLITGGLLAYGLMRTSLARFVVRVIGAESFRKMQGFFDRAGAWTIVLTRSLPYSIPEALVCLAGLAGMRLTTFVLALTLGSVPTGFVYAGIGAGWAEEPVLALVASWVLPIATLPIALYVMRRRSRV
jgi:uncharacterized membrane protein YdjX (TVP38/TMEM64 family)